MSTPLPFKSQRYKLKWRFWQFINPSKLCLENPRPQDYHILAVMTAVLTCYLTHNLHMVESILAISLWTEIHGGMYIIYIYKKLSKQGYIDTSTTPASAEFFFMEMKDCGLQPCFDYGGPNKASIKYISTPISSSRLARRETSGKPPPVHCHAIRFGRSFRGVSMLYYWYEDMLRACSGKYVIAYIDAILAFSADLQDHMAHVSWVLELLCENQLFVKGEKCEFHTAAVTLMGVDNWPTWSLNGFQEGQGRTGVAKTEHCKRIAAVLRICKFLSQLH